MPDIREITALKNKKASAPKGTKAERFRGTTPIHRSGKIQNGLVLP
jgi:hypothetical protein